MESFEHDIQTAKILIVDDAQMIRKSLRSILEGAGFEVVGEAEDGDEAVCMAASLEPDLITMDIIMKRMDGIRAARAIKKERPESRIVMITQNVRPSSLIESIRAGAENFIHKPFDPAHVVSVVKKALAG